MTPPIPLTQWQEAVTPEQLPLHIRRNIGPGEGGCWLWLRSKSPDGYGWASLDNRTFQAHRLVYRLLVGEPDEGLVLDHTRAVDALVSQTIRKAEDRARKAGLASFEAVAESTKKAIASIDLDGPFLAAAQLVTRARLTTPQAAEITRAVKAASSEADMLAAVEELTAQHRERIQATAGGQAKTTRSGRAQLLDACTRVRSVPQPAVVRSVIDDADAKALRRSCATAIEHLQALAAAIGDR